MKNTIKKAICTALAAVSLSALVAVPSALNNPASESSLVHVTCTLPLYPFISLPVIYDLTADDSYEK